MKNIPLLIRSALKPAYDKREKDTDAVEQLSRLYSDKRDGPRYRKGKWSVFLRKSYSSPRFVPADENDESGKTDGFCAVYLREEKPKLFISGSSADPELIDRTLETVSRRICDQRRLFSFPFKNLTEDNGYEYGIKVGFRIMLIVAVFVLFDVFLIPRQHEALARGLAISFTEGNEEGLDFSGYESVIERLAISLVGEENLGLVYSIYTLVGLFVVPILVITLWAEIAGKRADKVRMKQLPSPSLDFLYGIEAREGIFSEQAAREEEERKTSLYEHLSGRGYKADRKEFNSFFNEMLKEAKVQGD